MKETEKNHILTAKKILTVGIGANVDKREDFEAVRWQDLQGQKAEESLVKEAYDKFINKSELQKNAGIEHKIKITEEDMFRLAKDHILNDLKELRVKSSDYDKLPEQVQDVLLDMQYNMGGGKFIEKEWPNLFKGIKNRDWQKVRENVHRRDIQHDGNQWAIDRLSDL